MGNSNTPHSKKLRSLCAIARNNDLINKGYKRLHVLIPKESNDIVERLARRYGSKTAAMIAILEEFKNY